MPEKRGRVCRGCHAEVVCEHDGKVPGTTVLDAAVMRRCPVLPLAARAARALQITSQSLGSGAYRFAWSEPGAGKLEMAARLRRETTLTVKWIAGRVHLETSKGANRNLHQWMNNKPTSAADPRPCLKHQ